MNSDQLCGYCQNLIPKGQLSQHYKEKHGLNKQQQDKLKRMVNKVKKGQQ